MQLYGPLGAHFTLAVETESLLRLAKQLGFLRVVFLERQAAAVQGFQRQFAGFFRRVRAQFRGDVARATGENGDSEHQLNSQ